MRSPLVAAMMTVALASSSSIAADKTTRVEFQTEAGSKMSGTVAFATLKVKSDLGTMEIPLAKVERISSATEVLHWICLRSGDQIRGTIEEPKVLEVVTEFGRVKQEWKNIGHFEVLPRQ
jgi:hypothetical protein